MTLRHASKMALLVPIAACSIVAGLGPEPGPIAAPAQEGGAPEAGAETGADSGNGPAAVVGGCRIFPPDNPWNRDVSADPVDTDAMATIMPNMALATALHPDWGDTINGFGFPFNVVQAPPVPMKFVGPAAAQSDPVPCATGGGQFCYGVPPDAKVERDVSPHALVLDTTRAPNDCTLYELAHAIKDPTGPGWTADNGAVFHLGSNTLRPDGWISADPAGLPVLAGLVRFEETSLGDIKHALRMSMRNTNAAYIHPATHASGVVNPALPPMGLRLRLKASFDLRNFSGLALVVLRALQRYGVFVADRGTDWYISGESSDGWTAVMDDIVLQLGKVHGSDFEIVKSGSVSTVGL